LAEQILTEFIETSQNDDHDNTHSAPKTLSLADTRMEEGMPFPIFLQAFNEYLGALTTLLTEQRDTAFFASLHRARSETVSYDRDTMVVDLGVFVEDIVKICNPIPGSDLQVQSRMVWQTYNQMFVDQKEGPGTERGTGMTLDLPLISTYQKNPQYWKKILEQIQQQQHIPNFRRFFEAYVTSTLPADVVAPTNDGERVCRNRGVALPTALNPYNKDTLPTRGSLRLPNATLFLKPRLSKLLDDQAVVETDLSVVGTALNVYYGINVTSLVQEAMEVRQSSTSPHLRKSTPPGQQFFLILYGGSVQGEFAKQDSDFDFVASWDRSFYTITQPDGISNSGGGGNDDGDHTFHAVYVESHKDDEAVKKLPVVYFPSYNKDVREKRAIPVGTDVKAAELMGGEPGYLLFQNNQFTGDTSFTLYVRTCRPKLQLTGVSAACNVLEETSEGFLAPIVPVRGIVNGKEVTELVGGFTGKVLSWLRGVPLQVEVMSDQSLLDATGAEKVVLEMVAQSFDGDIAEVHTFDVLSSSQLTRVSAPFSPSDPGVIHNDIIPEGFNVAKCKPAIQSTTNGTNLGRHALTGDLTTMAETNCENSPWWIVDLLTARPISSVKIVNRQDCCTEHLEGLVIELLDSNDVTVTYVQHNPKVDGPIGAFYIGNFDNQDARKVRVSVQRPVGMCTILNLVSVEVYSNTCTEIDSCGTGLGCNYGDIALCKHAIQSSTSGTMISPASLEAQRYTSNVDATNAVSGSMTLSQTDCEAEPWWEVDLNQEKLVSHVVIKNREDCCYDWLNGLKVELFDSANELRAYFQHSPEISGAIRPMLIVHFDNVQTRKVRLSLDFTTNGRNNSNTIMVDGDNSSEPFCGILNLEEVQVYSDCTEGDACMTGASCETPV